jgi:hypothetical protein
MNSMKELKELQIQTQESSDLDLDLEEINQSNSSIELLALEHGYKETSYKEQEQKEKKPWLLKKLRPLHYRVIQLLLQNMKHKDIAAALGVHPVYVSMLSRQPLVQAEISKYLEGTSLKLETLFIKSVQAIEDSLNGDDPKIRLSAARLQMEATRKLSQNTGVSVSVNVQNNSISSEDNLKSLADRIISVRNKYFQQTQGVLEHEEVQQDEQDE